MGPNKNLDVPSSENLLPCGFFLDLVLRKKHFQKRELKRRLEYLEEETSELLLLREQQQQPILSARRSRKASKKKKEKKAKRTKQQRPALSREDESDAEYEQDDDRAHKSSSGIDRSSSSSIRQPKRRKPNPPWAPLFYSPPRAAVAQTVQPPRFISRVMQETFAEPVAVLETCDGRGGNRGRSVEHNALGESRDALSNSPTAFSKGEEEDPKNEHRVSGRCLWESRAFPDDEESHPEIANAAPPEFPDLPEPKDASAPDPAEPPAARFCSANSDRNRNHLDDHLEDCDSRDDSDSFSSSDDDGDDNSDDSEYVEEEEVL
jgi:hypothetical protein